MLRHVTGSEGVEIACDVTGAGPPLVLVHGAGSARWGFALLAPLLAEHFTVVVVDRRGRGDSGDGADYALEREFEDVAAVVAEAPALARTGPSGGPGVRLVGHSYGGLVAAGAAPLIAGLHALALYEPPMGGVLTEPGVIDRWEALVEAGERDRAVREFLGDVGGYRPAEIEELEATPVWELRRSVAHTMPRELRAESAYELDRAALGGLGVPVLLLVGSESPQWARRSTDAYVQAVPFAEVRRLEGQGHGAVAAAPALVAEELIRFL